MRFDLAVDHAVPGFRLDVTVQCEARVLALTGASGSGKTTLLNIVAGLVRPSRGRVAVDGDTFLDTDRGLIRPVYRRRIGYVFQDGRLFPHLTVLQNLRFGVWFAGGRAEAAWEAELVSLLGIQLLLGRRVGGLSGGERQRVAIGRALLMRPRLLLMDEPLAALDEARRLDLLALIERLRDRSGVPIIYVSHSQAEVARLADRVLTLRAGRLLP